MGHRNLWWLLETHLRAQAFLNAEQIESNTSAAHFEGPAKASDDPRDTPSSTQNKEERSSLTPRSSGITREEDWGSRWTQGWEGPLHEFELGILNVYP